MESENIDQLLLVTKLTLPPTYRERIMPRRRSQGQLDTGVQRPILLVSVPAGFGKTTFITKWLRQKVLSAVWVSLEEADRELVRNQIKSLSLTDQQVEELCQCAEGWIVGIQLATLSFNGYNDGSNVQHFIDVFTSTNRQGHEGPVLEMLSEREYSVLRLVSEGLSNQQIARHLVVTVSTVKTHLNNIYAKFHVHTRLQAVTKAYDLGLLNPWAGGSLGASETEDVPLN